MADVFWQGMDEFITALEGKANASQGEVSKVIERGANNIKRQLRDEMGQSRHFKQVAQAISYDMRSGGAFGGGFVEAEIGPTKGSPGSLANIAYFGTSRGGGTVADPRGALEAEMPNLEKFLGDFAEDI